MQHVRELITHLNYDDLVVTGKIPLLHQVLAQQTVVSKRYPPWVYRNQSFAQFGLTMDYWVRRILPEVLPEVHFTREMDPVAIKIQQTADTLETDRIMDLSRYHDESISWNQVIGEGNRLASFLLDTEPYSESQVQLYLRSLRILATSLASQWRRFGSALGTKGRFNAEFNWNQLTGHPDVVTETCVLDIKTTGDFSKMAISSFLQVLTYFAIRRQLDDDIRYIGFILPLQQQILVYDLEGWDWHPFLQVVSERCQILTATPNLDLLVSVESRLGRHLGTTLYLEDGTTKKITYPQALREYLQRGVRPVQMFLRPNRSGHSGSLTQAGIEEMRQLIENFGIPFYTHSPYLINLCSMATCRDPKDVEWGREVLRSDLMLTSELGGRGVVVHTGTRTVLDTVISEDEALRNMEVAVRSVLPSATEKCPLLLETPCGEGKEICVTPETLGDFYARFSEEERKSVKLCLDSAHVWAAGYFPMDYLKRWGSRFGAGSVRLIHYNDSRVEFNTHADRHAPIGLGYIPLTELIDLANWACQHNVSLVIE
jgi:deoxyribonuclease-4